MHWLLLMVAAIFEVGWVTGLRTLSASRPWLSAAVVAAYLLSFVFLAKAVEGIPLGVGYAVWTGIGVAGAFALSAVWFDEVPSSRQVLFAVVILIGVVGLYATTPTVHAVQ